MSDAARLTRQAFEAKSSGTAYSNFSVQAPVLQSIIDQLPTAVIDTAYAAIISYAEAMTGIRQGSSSWSIVRLYYSAFYSLKTMMLIRSIIPFNGGGEMLFDASSNKFYKGGRSSHHWNWHSIRQTSLKNDWFSSQDSQDAYDSLRTFRENVNYTHAFTDPNLHGCLVTGDNDIARKFRAYRDDSKFLYTYLSDHLAVAYPTKLIFEVDFSVSSLGYQLECERAQHLRAVWKIRDRCPVT